MMKRFSFWLAVALLCGSTSVRAQLEQGSFCITPKLGFMSASVTNMPDLPIADDIALKRSFFPGFLIGAECEYQLTDMVSVAAGLNYTHQGCKWKNYDMGNILQIKDIQTKLGYINLPVVANVYLFKGFAIKTGVQLGYLTNANSQFKIIYKTGTGPTQDTQADDNILSDCNKLDVTIPFGASFELNENLVIDSRYHLGLTRINKDKDEDGDLRNRGFLVTIGYRFPL